jgi:signal transduction histidine kinase
MRTQRPAGDHLNETASERLGAESDARVDDAPVAKAKPRPYRQARGVTGSTLGCVGIAVGLGGLYALGALLPFWFLKSPEAGAAFFPAAGLTLAVLLLTPRRMWPIWLAVIFATEFLVDITHGQSAAMATGFAFANTFEPLFGAVAVLWAVARRRSTIRDALLVYLIFGVSLGPMFGAIIGTTAASVFGTVTSWWSVAGTWWLGDALGVLIVATPLLAWSIRSPFETMASVGETSAMVLLAIGIAVVPALLWHHPLLYAVLPVLMWAALRGGWRAVTIAGVGVAFAADWAAVTGRADQLVAAGSTDQHLVFVQLFLAVTLLAALTLAVEVADRRRAESAVRKAEADRNRAERAAAAAAEGERRRIARETHDIVGHALNVVLLQAGAARRVIATDTELTRTFLESIETVGRDAFRDLDIALGLADRSPQLLPGRGLSSVPGLVDIMRQAGVAIDLDMDGCEQLEVSTLVDWSAYRIVQEALTNVAKHARGAHATVTVRLDGEEILLSIVDDGNGSPRPGAEGRGLIGIRERAGVLGGHIDLGPTRGGGFAVRARLPRNAT